MRQAVLDALRDGIQRTTLSAFGENKRAVLFGTTDCADAAHQIDRFAEEKLASPISQVLFVKMASACAAGLELSDGRKIFLKIHAGEHPPDTLRALHGIQEALREKGVPAARLILPAEEFGNGRFASVHAYRERGDRLFAYDKGTIPAAARALAHLMEAGRDRRRGNTDLPGSLTKISHPFAKSVSGTPRQKPPVPASARISAVLAAVTQDAKAVSAPRIVGHGDWASRNLRFAKGEVSSVFDFEALVEGPEAVLAGQAAIQFINEQSGVRDPAAAAAYFVDAYEKAAGKVFADEDAVALDAGIAFAVSSFCRAMVQSDGMRDEDAPHIFANFMKRFRYALGRQTSEKTWI